MTEFVFILPSGSMSWPKSDRASFNSMIQAEEAGVSVERQHGHPRPSATERGTAPDEKEYFTWGCTVLLDAVGGAIHHVGNIHKYARREDAGKTLFIITTDGYENASRRCNYETVRRMIQRQKEKCGWSFFVLGANIDAARGGGPLRHRCGPGGELQVRRGRHGAELRGHQ